MAPIDDPAVQRGAAAVVGPRLAACPRCGRRFGCDPGGRCWCAEEFVRRPVPTAGSPAACLCPDCLRQAAV